MKKTCAALLVAISSVFALHAFSGKTNIGLDSLMIGYKTANVPIIQRMDAIKANIDTIETRADSIAKNMNKKWRGKDIDKANIRIAIASLVFGIFGTLFALLGYLASRKTAKNVLRASSNVQKGQFDDLIRHLYRNLVCTLALSQKVLEESKRKKARGMLERIFSIRKKTEHKQYPSEEHLLKLKVLPEDVLQLEKYNNSPVIYQKMHELKLLLRNYDVEIETALMHLKDKSIALDVIKNDLDTLAYKPLHLIEAICGITEKIMKPKFNAFKNAATIMTREHISKLIKWGKKEESEFDAANYKDLNERITPPHRNIKIEQPYGGLSRSWNLLRKSSADKNQGQSIQDNVGLGYSERFDIQDENHDYTKYNAAIEKACKQVEQLNTFKENITSFHDFCFNEHFLTMLSIDVTIELSKIHMIDIKCAQ